MTNHRYKDRIDRYFTPETFKTLDERDREAWAQIVDEIDREREPKQTD